MHKPKYGVSLWKKDVDRIEYILKILKDAEIDHVEISIDSLLDINKPLINMIDKLSTNGISIGVHAPWREIYLASPLTNIRNASIDVIVKVVEHLAISHASYIVIHGSSEQPICDENMDLCVRSLVESANKLADRISIPIALETIQGKCCGNIDQLNNILDHLNDNIYIALDLAHIASEEIKKNNNLRDNLGFYLTIIPKKLLERTILMHIHGLKINRDHNIVRVKSHHDFTYINPGYMDIARYIYMYKIKYIVFEIFYTSKRSDPITIAINEIEKIRKFKEIYSY